jgi:hypothetical protein
VLALPSVGSGRNTTAGFNSDLGGRRPPAALWISHIRLSDKISRLHLRHVMPKAAPAQADEPPSTRLTEGDFHPNAIVDDPRVADHVRGAGHSRAVALARPGVRGSWPSTPWRTTPACRQCRHPVLPVARPFPELAEAKSDAELRRAVSPNCSTVIEPGDPLDLIMVRPRGMGATARIRQSWETRNGYVDAAGDTPASTPVPKKPAVAAKATREEENVPGPFSAQPPPPKRRPLQPTNARSSVV